MDYLDPDQVAVQDRLAGGALVADVGALRLLFHAQAVRVERGRTPFAADQPPSWPARWFKKMVFTFFLGAVSTATYPENT